jgi:hypothetical protein
MKYLKIFLVILMVTLLGSLLTSCNSGDATVQNIKSSGLSALSIGSPEIKTLGNESMVSYIVLTNNSGENLTGLSYELMTHSFVGDTTLAANGQCQNIAGNSSCTLRVNVGGANTSPSYTLKVIQAKSSRDFFLVRIIEDGSQVPVKVIYPHVILPNESGSNPLLVQIKINNFAIQPFNTVRLVDRYGNTLAQEALSGNSGIGMSPLNRNSEVTILLKLPELIVVGKNNKAYENFQVQFCQSSESGINVIDTFPEVYRIQFAKSRAEMNIAIQREMELLNNTGFLLRGGNGGADMDLINFSGAEASFTSTTSSPADKKLIGIENTGSFTTSQISLSVSDNAKYFSLEPGKGTTCHVDASNPLMIDDVLAPSEFCFVYLVYTNAAVTNRSSTNVGVNYTYSGGSGHSSVSYRAYYETDYSDAVLSSNVDQYQFGTIVRNGQDLLTTTVTITNTGGDDAIELDPFFAGGSSLFVIDLTNSSCKGTLVAGASCNYIVKFGPTILGNGTYNEDLLIPYVSRASGSKGQIRVHFVGGVRELHTANVAIDFVSANGFQGDGSKNLPFAIQQGTSGSMIVSIKNFANYDATGFSISINGISGYSIINNDCQALNILAAGASCNIEISPSTSVVGEDDFVYNQLSVKYTDEAGSHTIPLQLHTVSTDRTYLLIYAPLIITGAVDQPNLTWNIPYSNLITLNYSYTGGYKANPHILPDMSKVSPYITINPGTPTSCDLTDGNPNCSLQLKVYTDAIYKNLTPTGLVDNFYIPVNGLSSGQVKLNFNYKLDIVESHLSANGYVLGSFESVVWNGGSIDLGLPYGNDLLGNVSGENAFALNKKESGEYFAWAVVTDVTDHNHPFLITANWANYYYLGVFEIFCIPDDSLCKQDAGEEPDRTGDGGYSSIRFLDTNIILRDDCGGHNCSTVHYNFINRTIATSSQ